MREVEQSLYMQMGGFDKVLDMCRNWHRFCLANPEACHPFEHGMHPYHDERLAAYFTEAFGGPALYPAGDGTESSMQRVHAGNGVHIALDEACLFEFDRALAEIGVTGPTAEAASRYFRQATEEQRAYSAAGCIVPEGLQFNYASFSGDS